MIRTLSSNEAKQQWGSIMSSVGNDGDEVIVESHGKPKVAVVPYAEFQEYQAARKNQIKVEALAKFQDWKTRNQDRNSDLTEEEVEELAARFRREFGESFAAKNIAGSTATKS